MQILLKKMRPDLEKAAAAAAVMMKQIERDTVKNDLLYFKIFLMLI